LLRANAGWLLTGLIAAAVLFSAGSCGGEGRSSNEASGGFIAFRQATPTPIPTQAPTRPVVSTRPCGAWPWIRVKDVLICVPPGATLSTLFVDPPVGSQYAGDLHFDVIRRGASEVRIGIESGEIVKWDVAAEDEEEFRRLIREPLEEAGY